MIELRKYDVIEAKIAIKRGSVQRCKERRPYVIVSNDKGTQEAPTIIIMPLTHVIKSLHLPVHGCIEAKSENGLDTYSMILGEQPQTINKTEVVRKRGRVVNQRDRNTVNRITYNSFFWGENINWEEVLKDDKQDRSQGDNKKVDVKNASEGMRRHRKPNPRKISADIAGCQREAS